MVLRMSWYSIVEIGHSGTGQKRLSMKGQQDEMNIELFLCIVLLKWHLAYPLQCMPCAPVHMAI